MASGTRPAERGRIESYCLRVARRVLIAHQNILWVGRKGGSTGVER